MEGRLLALTSLRDLLGRPVDEEKLRPDEVGGAGGDLSSEMRRLGEVTARLHLALAEAFGVRRLEDAEALAGAAIRVHGDYHLRRVFRTDDGWVVGGFGDDPLIGRPDGHDRRRVRYASPLEDLADLSYSLRQVAAEALAAQPAVRWAQAERLAKSWDRRNRGAFLSGYLGVDGIGELVSMERPAVAENIKSLVALRTAVAT